MEDRGSSEPARLADLLGDTYDTLAGEETPTISAGSGRHAPHPLTPERMLALIWPEVVGTEVAANARPVQLRGKRLVVSASSSVWAQSLHFMGAAIVGGINERLGADVVEQIVFRHAGWEERSQGHGGAAPETGRSGRVVAPIGDSGGPGATPAEAPRSGVTAVDAALSEEQQAALAQVERLDLAPELRDRMLRAMRAAFVRGEKDSVR